MMVELLDPREGESIYDPACGTGGMLLGAIEHVERAGGDARTFFGRIFGEEKNLTTSSIARMNLVLHGVEDFRIEQNDTLRDPAFTDTSGALATFDCVIANPPFSLKEWGREVWEADPWGRAVFGLPPASYGDYAWVQQMVASMAEGSGRMAVVLPQGALFRKGAEGRIRRALLEQDLVEAVIGLAPNIFYGTGLSPAVVTLRRAKRRGRRGKVMVIDASSLFRKGRAQNFLDPAHAEQIVRWVRRFPGREGPGQGRLDRGHRGRGPDAQHLPLRAAARRRGRASAARGTGRLQDRVDGGPLRRGSPAARAGRGRLAGVTRSRRATTDREHGNVADAHPSPGHLGQQALESYLWGAANLLRGLIDAGDYKQYVFPLLFFKRLSDVWDEDHRHAFDDTGDRGYAQATANDRFIIPAGAHWSDVRSASRDVGRTLRNAFRAIETANPERLVGVFGNAPWTDKAQMPDATLKNLIEHFSKHSLSLAAVPEDELGNAYEYLVKQFADDSGHTAQEFYSNRTLVHLMTRMLRPRPGDRIYDPTAGTGGMLISALAEVRRNGGDVRTLSLYGQEIIGTTASIARMNLVLHGVEDFHIAVGNTLSDPAFSEQDRLMTFDVVLANPPYSIKTWNRDAWLDDPWGRNILGTPPQGRADYAFFQHILQSLDRKTGRCAILFPHGVLFRQEEAAMRRALIERDLVECVLGLGPNLFYNSPMEACVVVCRTRKPPERRGKVLFIDAVRQVARERSQSFLRSDHQKRILSAYEVFGDEPGFAAVASNDDVLANDGNLSILRYVPRTADTDTDTQTAGKLREAWTDFDAGSEAFWSEMEDVVVMVQRIATESRADG